MIPFSNIHSHCRMNLKFFGPEYIFLACLKHSFGFLFLLLFVWTDVLWISFRTFL
jgi:hypothetical protein